MEHAHCLADLPEDLADNVFAHVAALNLFEEGAAVGVLQYHIRDILLLLVVVIQQLHDTRMVETLVQGDLVLRVFVIDLR